MKEILQMLFDYQRFHKNEKLDREIHETPGCRARELNIEELSQVNAAGGTEYEKIPADLPGEHIFRNAE